MLHLCVERVFFALMFETLSLVLNFKTANNISSV